MAVGDHLYVVPGEALPYLGRQLDLGAVRRAGPRRDLQVDGPSDHAPAVPGLDLRPAGGGRSIGRIVDPAAFGAALARDTAAARATAARRTTAGAQASALAAGALAGVRAIGAGKASEPTANRSTRSPR